MDDGATKLILQNTDRNANCFMLFFFFIGSLTVLVKLKTIFNLLAANRLSSHLKMGFNCNCARQRARLFCCVLLVNPIKDLILTPNLLEI